MDMAMPSMSASATVPSAATATVHSASMSGMSSSGAMSSMPPMSSSDSMPAMAMAMTFSASTRVTLLFSGWTTTNAGTYIASILLLFALSILHRFLGSLRVQLEKSWQGQVPADEEVFAAESQKRRSTYTEDSEETEPLSPRVPTKAGDEAQPKRFWTPSGSWDWRRDGLRAGLEFLRAGLGYLLMLTVMTFDVGVFCAVLGGIFVGELVFGRFALGGAGRGEGGCHD